MLLHGDCLGHLKNLPSESVDLCYIDPPFATGRDFGDFKDTMSREDYLIWIEPILKEIHRILKKTGSFYFHIDVRTSHYLKCILDDIYGDDSFINEILWKRRNGCVNVTRKYQENIDRILFYTKSKNYTFNVKYILSDKPLKERRFDYIETDGRIYKKGGLTNTFPGNKGYHYIYKGYSPPKNRGWRVTESRMKELDEQGLLLFLKERIFQKYYLDGIKGSPLASLWTDIQQTRFGTSENTGYATQKPLDLLERIISVSSNPGDTVLDCFAGSGTTLVAAQNLGRKWIGVDISDKAISISKQRLNEDQRMSGLFGVTSILSLVLPKLIEYGAEELEKIDVEPVVRAIVPGERLDDAAVNVVKAILPRIVQLLRDHNGREDDIATWILDRIK